MAQAEKIPTTSLSRRKLIAGAAALPAAAVVSPASASADAELLAMEPVVTERWNGGLTPVLDELERAESAQFEWTRGNPGPHRAAAPSICGQHQAEVRQCSPKIPTPRALLSRETRPKAPAGAVAGRKGGSMMNFGGPLSTSGSMRLR